MQVNNKESFFWAVLSNRPHFLLPFLLESTSWRGYAWSDNYVALHWAALYGCEQSVELLLRHGADPKALITAPEVCPDGDSNVWYDFEMRRQRQGWSARDLAINAGFPEIAETLKQAGSPSQISEPDLHLERWHERAKGQRQLGRSKLQSSSPY